MARTVTWNGARAYRRGRFSRRTYHRRVATTRILPSMAKSDVRCRSQHHGVASAPRRRARLARVLMSSLSRQQAEEILFEEARILDDRRYDEWFAMLTDDAIYWVPCGGEGLDPNREISLVYDDHARLRDRIDRLGSGVAHAQSPPSKTCRLISNVQIEQTSDDAACITSAFFLYELRHSRQRVFAG